MEYSNLNDGSITLERLREEFKMFSGDYMYFLNFFEYMSEEYKKMFILYSIFYFDLKFHRDDYECVVSEEFLLVLDKYINKSTQNGKKYRWCDLYFNLVGGKNSPKIGAILKLYGCTLFNVLECDSCFKNLDFLSLQDLALFAKNGYSSLTEREGKFYNLNGKRSRELEAFTYTMNTLSFSKTK